MGALFSSLSARLFICMYSALCPVVDEAVFHLLKCIQALFIPCSD
jgi:hypothetical protein